jgi:hypothetical protein
MTGRRGCEGLDPSRYRRLNRGYGRCRSAAEPGESEAPSEFAYESDLRDFLAKNLSVIAICLLFPSMSTSCP